MQNDKMPLFQLKMEGCGFFVLRTETIFEKIFGHAIANCGWRIIIKLPDYVQTSAAALPPPLTGGGEGVGEAAISGTVALSPPPRPSPVKGEGDFLASGR